MKIEIQSKTGTKVVNTNRRKSIRERCMNCSGWSYKEISECEFSDCPLFDFRLGAGKQNSKQRSISIRKYCLWCMAGRPAEVGKCTTNDCPLFPYRQTKVDRSAQIGASCKRNDT